MWEIYFVFLAFVLFNRIQKIPLVMGVFISLFSTVWVSSQHIVLFRYFFKKQYTPSQNTSIFTYLAYMEKYKH